MMMIFVVSVSRHFWKRLWGTLLSMHILGLLFPFLQMLLAFAHGFFPFCS